MLQKLKSLSALLRLPNLLILALTVYIYSYNILYPALLKGGLHNSLRFKDFLLFLFIVMCTAAGGYILNDIIDRKSDQINQKRGLIGNHITSTMAWLFYWFVVLAPIPLVYSLSSEIHNLHYLFAYIGVVFILFLYNILLKRLPLIGNITVAFLCTYVFLLPALIEIDNIRALKSLSRFSYDNCLVLTISFSIFVFLTHITREIVKDAEDKEGDKALGYHTLPIILSNKNLKTSLLFIEGVLLISILSWILTATISPFLVGINLVLLLPLMALIIYKTVKALDKNDYTTLSMLLKYLMMSGLISLSLTSI